MSSRISPRRTKRQKRGASNEDPTSTIEKTFPAPKVIDGIIEFPLEPLKDHLTCSLCKGYLRCAHTISECLHSFCKSCLFCVYNQGKTSCPQCFVNLGPDPYPVTLFDRTLQELVDKVLPELEVNDKIDERDYYRAKGIKPKKEFAAEIQKESDLAAENVRDDVGDGSSVSGKEVAQVAGNTRSSPKRRNAKDKASTKIDIPVPPDELDIELRPDEVSYEEPKKKRIRTTRGRRGRFQSSPSKEVVKTCSLPTLSNSCIRTSGRLKIAQLKKYLASQLGLDLDQQSNLSIRCNGDVVGDELSLTFIHLTRWLLPDEDMILHYSVIPTIMH
jgi:hypothetical protein